MGFTKGSAAARLAGKKSSLLRWARASPAQRAEQGRVMHAGIMARYREQARAIAAEAGWEPTDEQVERSAVLLWHASLADRRLMAYQAVMGKTAERRAD